MSAIDRSTTRTPLAPELAPNSAQNLATTILMGVVFAFIWSSAFSVAKIVVAYAPPFSVSAVRFALGAAIGFGVAVALGQKAPRGGAAWRAILVLGVFQNAFYLGFVFAAVQTIDATLAIIIASALPLIVAALSPWLLGESVGPLKTFGLLLGFAGVLWVAGARVAGGVDTIGLLFAIAAVASLATATLLVRRVDFGTGPLMVAACQMAVGAFGCALIAVAFEDVFAFDLQTPLFIGVAYQILLPGLVATVLWFTLLKRIPAADASAFHFLVPIFGTGFAVALLGEAVTASDAIGVAFAAAGILIVNRAGALSRRRRP